MSLADIEGPPGETRRTGVEVSIFGLAKAFDGRPVLQDLDLAIPAGQFVAIVGRSGSGKSTLLRLLGGLDRPSVGTILLDGSPARTERVRVMFQEARLLPWARVVDNVAVGLAPGGSKAVRSEQALAALRDVGLGSRAGDWPTVLSGGQKQRVALARALAGRPGLLLLDEPLGALDALTRLEMQDLLAEAWRARGCTAVLVTHDVAEAVRLADRILLLEHGTVTMDLPNPHARQGQRFSAGAAALEEQILGRLMAG